MSEVKLLPAPNLNRWIFIKDPQSGKSSKLIQMSFCFSSEVPVEKVREFIISFVNKVVFNE